MLEWISASEGCPKPGEVVLLKTKYEEYDLGTMVTLPWYEGEWSFYHGQNLGYPLEVIEFLRFKQFTEEIGDPPTNL